VLVSFVYAAKSPRATAQSRAATLSRDKIARVTSVLENFATASRWRCQQSLSPTFLFLPTAKDEFLPSPPLPLEVGPLNTARGLGLSPSRQTIWCIGPIGVKKVQLWWQQFLLIF